MELLNDGNMLVRSAAMVSLHQLGKVAVPALLDALDSKKSRLRLEAAEVLGQMREQDALPGLIKLLADSKSDIRIQAAKSLSQLPHIQTAIPVLIDCLHDPKAHVRLWAAAALGKSHEPCVISSLMDTARDDPEERVSDMAVSSLGTLKATEAVPLLGSLLFMKTWSDMRDTILEALARIGDEAAIQVLYEATRNAAMRDDALDWITSLSGTGHPLIVQACIEAISDENEQIRWMVIRTLGDIGDPAATSALIEHLSDYVDIGHDSLGESTSVRLCDLAAHALERIGSPEALAAVAEWRRGQQ